MSTLSDLASRYRWELMLVLVIPFVSGVIELLLIVPLIALDTLLGANTITLKLLSIVQPILLAIFYFRVRALGRSMLTLAWSYSLIILATSAVIDPAFEYFYEEGLFWEHVFYWGAVGNVPGTNHRVGVVRKTGVKVQLQPRTPVYSPVDCPQWLGHPHAFRSFPHTGRLDILLGDRHSQYCTEALRGLVARAA